MGSLSFDLNAMRFAGGANESNIYRGISVDFGSDWCVDFFSFFFDNVIRKNIAIIVGSAAARRQYVIFLFLILM